MDTDQHVTFTIHGKRPSDFTIERLADYLRLLADLVGAPEKVRVEKITPGSVKVGLAVQHEHYPRFAGRMVGATTPSASRELRRTVESMREMLSEDGVSVDMRAGKSRIFHLRGYEREHGQVIGPIHQRYVARGQVIGLEGKDDTKHVRLLDVSTTRELRGEIRDQTLAEQLKTYLWKGTVEVGGFAKLCREPQGTWTVSQFRVDTVTELDSAPLTQALQRLHDVLGKDVIEAELRGISKGRGR